jgi:hypothetical protein
LLDSGGSSWILIFQDADDGGDRVPVACGRGAGEEFVDASEIADGLHVTAVDAEDELALRGEDADEPVTLRRKADREGCVDSSGFGEDADEADRTFILRRWFGGEGILVFEAEKIVAVAEDDFGFEGQGAEQGGAEFRLGAGLADDESAGSADIHDVVFAKFLREKAWAKGSVPANIDAAKEDDESHKGDYEGRGV